MLQRHLKRLVQFACVAAVLLLGSASALDLKPEMTITAYDRDGNPHLIGELRSQPKGDGYAIEVKLADDRFSEHFLSMRDFQCLDLGKEMVCHLAYFYDIKNHVTASDLTDLEYQLLFVRKRPEDYNSINAWNGLYYRLEYRDGKLYGTLMETDLNVLAAPPEDGDLRPIKPDALYEASDTQWLPRIVIE